MLPPPPPRPLLLLLFLVLVLLVGTAAAAASVPLRFSLCGADRLGIRSIRLNQWPGKQPVWLAL